MPETSLSTVNDRAIALRAQGRLREAVAAFSEGIVQFPQAAVLYNNLAMTLDELGAPKEALLAYDSALARSPTLVASLTGKAGLLLRDGLVDEARTFFERALSLDADSLAAHLGMYELLQIKGDLAGAVCHQEAALRTQRFFSYTAPNAQRSVLVLCAPGDWQANVPVDFLFDRATTSVHKLFLIDDAPIDLAKLPQHDVIFNAVAESDEATPYLDRVRRFADADDAALLNAPERVREIGRRRLPETLAGTGCLTLATIEATPNDLQSGALPIAYPAIVRPVGSHAGHHLERIASSEELRDYESRVQAAAYFASAFVDYVSGDGMFRKYRIVFVDGTPYPVHLAISPNWMIHYYNAPMADNAWMRDEEALFLSDLESVFFGDLRTALDSVARATGLEYFGIDCAVGPDGRLLVFEADTAMLVHTSDPVELYPYKREFVPRIYRAIERMVDRRKAADT
jgi:tetratricopeptide (TPR) repeat protein